MELNDQSDHVALLSLMQSGVLTKRLVEVGQLYDQTAEHIHKLVQGARIHARHVGPADLNVLFDNIDNSPEKQRTSPEAQALWPAVHHR
jgi:hypothetical protein